MLPALAPSIGVPTISTGTDIIPYDVDSQGNQDIGEATGIPTKMSPMDSLKAIFEEIRDGINELVLLTREAMPNTRDMSIGAADVEDIPAPQENDSQGNKFKLPEIGPKTGLGLMLVGLAALYAFGDEIAKAIEYIMTHPKKAKEMGQNGRKLIEKKYNWSIEERKLNAIYSSIV